MGGAPGSGKALRWYELRQVPQVTAQAAGKLDPKGLSLEPAVAAAHLSQAVDHLPSASTARRTFQVRLRVAALAIWFNTLRDLSPGLLPDLG